MSTIHDTTALAVKTAPSIAMTAWSFWGFTLNEWAAIATVVYTTLMTIFLLIDRYKKWKKR